jgi:site-specific DNA-methyltransferase (adenine-specific)
MADKLLYYGDNLEVLCEHIADDSVDLIYLDPPFNSSRDYNVLFKQAKRDENQAQMVAFEDTWQWSTQRYEELRNEPRYQTLLPIVGALYSLLGKSEMMAYLVMMAPRLHELKRVLKPTGSLYLHCDPTASHYLKLLLDVVFGPMSFRNEITWKRTTTHSDAKRWSPVADILLYYCKTDRCTWHPQYLPHTEEYVASKYRNVDSDGRRYRLDNMTSPNPRPNMMYEWKGFPYPQYGWRYSRDTMERLDREGRIWYPEDKTKRPQLKRYLDEMSGNLITNVWTDISPINSQAQERMGYPTQKPLALLERIINASSNPGDMVLDPFCGCGTATVASEKLGRRWIGIDITYLAMDLIMQRLADDFHLVKGVDYQIIGDPKDAYAARKLFAESPKQFEVWAVTTLANGVAQPNKSGDHGIDGKVYFDDLENKLRYAVVQVKGGGLTPGLIRDFAHVVGHENAVMGYFICMETPTRGMYQTAEEAGMVTAPSGRLIPKLQIRTVHELMHEGKAFDAPKGYTLKSGKRMLVRAHEQPSLGI